MITLPSSTRRFMTIISSDKFSYSLFKRIGPISNVFDTLQPVEEADETPRSLDSIEDDELEDEKDALLFCFLNDFVDKSRLNPCKKRLGEDSDLFLLLVLFVVS